MHQTHTWRSHPILGLKQIIPPRKKIFQYTNEEIDLLVCYFPNQNLYKAILRKNGKVFLPDKYLLQSHYLDGLLQNLRGILANATAIYSLGLNNTIWLREELKRPRSKRFLQVH